MENVKIDIIYYCMEGDFELEFNLGGCGKIRTLTDNSKDRKSHLKSLSRAVSRSKIIITCGPLFGTEGLIYITAKAIGKETVTINNAEYGIDAEGEIEVIDGSLPLVTSDGVFGGCIIESGPQTLIMLSENKAIRKYIMQNLIHPYIEEIGVMQLKNEHLGMGGENSAAKEIIGGAAVAAATAAVAADLPEAPEMPEIPQVPETPQEPEIPEITETPAVTEPETAEVTEPETAEITEPQAEAIPEEPQAEATPEEPQVEAEEQRQIDIFAFTGNSAQEESAAGKKEETENDSFAGLPTEVEDVFDENEIIGEIESDEITAGVDVYQNPPEVREEKSRRHYDGGYVPFVFEEDTEENTEEETVPAQNFVSKNEQEFYDDEDFVTEDEYEKKQKRITALIIAAMVAVILITLCYIFLYLPYKQGTTPIEFIKSILNSLKP